MLKGRENCSRSANLPQIFFGTPHYAPDTTSWELLFLDIGLASIEKAPEHRLRTLQAITKAGAASLHEISEGFDRIAPNFKLLSIIGMKASKRSLSNVSKERISNMLNYASIIMRLLN